MLVLELLGTLSLRDDARPVPASAQQKRPLGLLGILALGGKRGLSRDRIETYLWPETSSAPARHSLDQTVYSIRNALGSDCILATGRELRLNPDLFGVDVWTFEEATQARNWPAAVNCYQGPLLDGIHIADSRELESWIDAERARLRMAYHTALELLAKEADEAGDHAQSVTWWRKLVSSDPLSADATKKLMRALALAGDRVGAVKQGRLYQQLVRQELEIEPDSGVETLAATFRGNASSGIAIAATPPTPPGSPTPVLSPPAITAGKPSRMKRSRIVAVLSASVLIVLLVGAVTVRTRQSLEHRVGVGAATGPVKSRLVVASARDSYVRGLNAWSDGSREGLDSAVEYFTRATQLDPTYAEAYAGLADAYVMLGYFGYRPSDAMFPKAKQAALRSLQIDSTLASPHPALAYELAWERDFVGANSEFRKAVALDPTYARTKAIAVDPMSAMEHQWYAILLMILGDKPQITEDLRASHGNAFSVSVPVVEITFTKWFTAYPALAGFTSYGPGTMGGEVLTRIDDGVFTHLNARYEVTDPAGTRSFKAVIQGKANNDSGRYELNGIVTWGWMLGARVRASFVRLSPCQFGTLNVCFQGIIQIQRR
jgi:DNA-binding SARP family transcriptional activator/Tfp pilus assembly protein PilF